MHQQGKNMARLPLSSALFRHTWSCTLFALLPAAALAGFPYPPPCPLITRRHDMGRSGIYGNFKTLLHSLSLRTIEDEYEWRRMRSDMEAAVL